MRQNVSGFRILGFVLVFFAGMGTAIVGDINPGRAVFAGFFTAGSRSVRTQPDYNLVQEAANIISKEYVGRGELQDKTLTYGAIGGMIGALKDAGHSTFLTPDMLNIQRHYIVGNVSGIGIRVRMRDGQVVVLAPMEESPAQRAGLGSGDIILKVNGIDVLGLRLDQVVSRITGKPGTTVSLTVLSKKTGETRQLDLVRAIVNVPNVTWQQLPGTRVAHVRIAGFSETVPEDLREALTEIRKERLTGLILDLRDNPGGTLNAAVRTASQFLDSGNVVVERDAAGRQKTIPVQPGALAPRIPMVVLVNGGSASASEIVAGALQDSRRAMLVGEKTFGAGTVLREFRLSDGSALLLAIEEWLTPNGNEIWRKGVTPNVEVVLPPGASPLYPDKEKLKSAAQLKASPDTQIRKALDLLSRGGEQAKS